jgi:hypothetical protein
MEAQSLLKKMIWYRRDRSPFFFGVFIVDFDPLGEADYRNAYSVIISPASPSVPLAPSSQQQSCQENRFQRRNASFLLDRLMLIGGFG